MTTRSSILIPTVMCIVACTQAPSGKCEPEVGARIDGREWRASTVFGELDPETGSLHFSGSRMDRHATRQGVVWGWVPSPVAGEVRPLDCDAVEAGWDTPAHVHEPDCGPGGEIVVDTLDEQGATGRFAFGATATGFGDTVVSTVQVTDGVFEVCWSDGD